MKTNPEFDKKVADLILSGRSTIVIRDNDNESWNSGWAAYVMKHFSYTNIAQGAKCFLDQPIKEAR